MRSMSATVGSRQTFGGTNGPGERAVSGLGAVDCCAEVGEVLLFDSSAVVVNCIVGRRWSSMFTSMWEYTGCYGVLLLAFR